MFLTEHKYRQYELNCCRSGVSDGTGNIFINTYGLYVKSESHRRVFEYWLNIQFYSEKKICFVTNENEKSSLFLWNDREAANRKRHITISTARSGGTIGR